MAVKPIVKTFEYFLDRLLRGFKKDQGREPNNLEMILIRQEAGGKARDANKVIQFPYKKSFGEEVDEMIAKGEVNVGTADKTPPYQKSQADIEFEIMERIKSDNEKAIKAFESRNPNKKPRDEKYTGGIVDVEPSLSDIGHGSDALMARTRLVSPGNQATTSTGLNYLLAEDNDNLRVPFANGNGVADEDAENAKFAKRVRELMDEGFDMGEAVREAMKEGYAEGGRIGFSKGKAVTKGLDYLMDLFTNKKMFRSKDDVPTSGFSEKTGPITIEDMMNIPEDELRKIRRTQELGLYDETPEILKAGNLFERFTKKVGGERVIDYDRAEFILNRKLKGNETLNDLLQIEYQTRPGRAEGGRIGFSKGKIAKEVLDKGRRGFMKAAGAGAAGLAALKTGLLGFGEKAAPVVEKVAETVSETAQSVPPYFFRLVEKIRQMGDETMASQDKAIAKKYKDYVMEEDFAGNITIVKSGEDLEGNKLEDVYMSYKVDDVALKDKDGFAKAEEYEEFTARPDMEGKMKDVEPGVPDEVIEEAGDIDAMTLKKADGGRIGYSKGKLVFENAAKFLEKIFGKENMAEMPNRDPEMYQGMLEVVDMFRKRDKEGLKKYMQKYLPHMDDETVEAFIKGDAEDMAGLGKFGLDNIQGQLIRLGSGRDYKDKIEAVKRLERKKSLRDLEVTDEMIRKPNAAGGLAKMLGE